MRPRRNPDSVSRELGDGEIMILVSSTTTGQGEGAEQAVVLNAVGTAVWHLADGERDIDTIAGIIADHYPDIGIARVRDDVDALVHQLVERGVFLCSPNPTP